jgi:oligopeptide/dipeptide ABC transporter ATP-binding protein
VAFAAALIAAVPEPDSGLGRSSLFRGGDVGDPVHAPSGCCFHPRCAYAEDVCRSQASAWEEAPSGCFVSCHCAAASKLQSTEALDEMRG